MKERTEFIKQNEVNTHDNNEMRGDKNPRSGGEGENTTFVYKVSKKSGTMVTTTIIINMYQVGLELGVGRNTVSEDCEATTLSHSATSAGSCCRHYSILFIKLVK